MLGVCPEKHKRREEEKRTSKSGDLGGGVRVRVILRVYTTPLGQRLGGIRDFWGKKTGMVENALLSMWRKGRGGNWKKSHEAPSGNRGGDVGWGRWGCKRGGGGNGERKRRPVGGGMKKKNGVWRGSFSQSRAQWWRGTERSHKRGVEKKHLTPWKQTLRVFLLGKPGKRNPHRGGAEGHQPHAETTP